MSTIRIAQPTLFSRAMLCSLSTITVSGTMYIVYLLYQLH
jgi:hypothetical protein